MKPADRFKPGDIAWHVDWGNSPNRKPVIIVRRAMCKDWPSWDRRNKTAEGITFARHMARMSWLTISDGQTALLFDHYLFKRQYKPRRPK